MGHTVSSHARTPLSRQPFYVVHPLHAWDEGEDVVIWAPLGSQLRPGKALDPEQVIYGAQAGICLLRLASQLARAHTHTHARTCRFECRHARIPKCANGPRRLSTLHS